MRFTNQQLLAIGLVILVLVWYLKRQAAEAADLVNPTSRDNLAYSGANSVGQALSGDEYWTLGGWLYEITHPSEEG